jgi:hypothetical protein
MWQMRQRPNPRVRADPPIGAVLSERAPVAAGRSTRLLGWLPHEHRTTTEAAVVAIPTHYRVFTRHTLVGCGRSGFIRADQHWFAHTYLDILVPSRT